MNTADLVAAYSRDPVGKYELQNPTITNSQSNAVCGDEVVVFLLIEDGILIEWSWIGETHIQTTTAASMLCEEIQNRKLSEVLTRTYDFMRDLGLEFSPRRRRSAVSALLATRNAIHTYLNDGRIDTYEDVL